MFLIGALSLVTATVLLLTGFSLGWAVALYIFGLFCLFRGEQTDSQRIVIDHYGVRKQFEKPSAADYERVKNENLAKKEQEHQNANADLNRQIRLKIDKDVDPLSYYVRFVEGKNGWLAISNDWVKLENGASQEIEEFDRFSEDNAVIKLHKKLAELRASNLLQNASDQ